MDPINTNLIPLKSKCSSTWDILMAKSECINHDNFDYEKNCVSNKCRFMRSMRSVEMPFRTIPNHKQCNKTYVRRQACNNTIQWWSFRDEMLSQNSKDIIQTSKHWSSNT
jgi:hypothetical protein